LACRSAYRSLATGPDYSDYRNGFRVVLAQGQ
jgi:hypothetical protein